MQKKKASSGTYDNMECAPLLAHVNLPSSRWLQCMALHASTTTCKLYVTSCLLMHILTVSFQLLPSITTVNLYTHIFAYWGGHAYTTDL